jgi:hypothetical protein
MKKKPNGENLVTLSLKENNLLWSMHRTTIEVYAQYYVIKM